MIFPHIAQQLLTAFEAHRDMDRFNSACFDKAERVVTQGQGFDINGITNIHCYFSDNSSIEFDKNYGFRVFGPGVTK